MCKSLLNSVENHHWKHYNGLIIVKGFFEKLKFFGEKYNN